MKSCTRCSNMLADNATYCAVCNTSLTAGFEEFEITLKYSDTFLKVLCILTIIGAAISLISVPISLASTPSMGIEMPKGILYLGLAIAIGKLTGAIFMLQKKLTGLYIYTVAAVLSIISSIYSTVTVTAKVVGTGIAIAGGVIGIVFIIAFLIMYWLPVNRRLLS